MRKNHYWTSIISLMMLLISCGQSSTSEKADTEVKKDTSAVSDQKPTEQKEIRTDFTLVSGKIMELVETHPNGASLSTIRVGFKNDSASTLEIRDMDPVFRTFPADLDGNGFGEIYVITQSAGSGSYGNVYGFASNKDRSISMVYLPEVSEEQKKKGGPFEGYEGHDLFEINGKQLIRSFPVKDKTRTITYKMKQGEAGYLLVIQSSTIN
jgi:hypothetical protein